MMSTVAKIMNKQPKTVGPAVSIVSAAKKMKTARVGSLFVKKGKKLIGIVTDTDIGRDGTSNNIYSPCFGRNLRLPIGTCRNPPATLVHRRRRTAEPDRRQRRG